MATSISQLPSASTAEIVDGALLVVNTTDNETKTMSLDTFRNAFFCDLKCVKLEIASADVLMLNSSPITIVAAQGAGTVIDVISATAYIDYNTATYATNVDLEIINQGATVAQYTSSNFLDATSSKMDKFTQSAVAVSSNSNMGINTDLRVKVRSGDPTTGDSDITIYLQYRVLVL